MIPPRLCFYGDFAAFHERFSQIADSPKRYPFGAVLYKAAETPRFSYYIEEGWIKLTILNEAGREVTVFYLGPGSVFPINCMDELFSMDQYLHMVAITEITVLSFPAGLLSALIGGQPRLAVAAVNFYSKLCDQLMARLLLSSYDSADCLISTVLYLYAYYNPYEPTVVDMSQEKLGNITGLSRTQVVRTLGELRKNGIISTARKTIKILDLGLLKAHCAGVILS